ncbi:hypothetical protein E4T56_gene15680, partial [Termitomyces sp. T112]
RPTVFLLRVDLCCSNIYTPAYIDELRPVPSARACSSCFIPDPTSLRSVRSSIFYSMLHPRPN